MECKDEKTNQKINRAPYDHQSWLEFGKILLEKKDYKNAVVALENSILFCENLLVRDHLVNIYYDMGEYGKAKEHGLVSLSLKDKIFSNFFKKNNVNINLKNSCEKKFNKETPEKNIIAFSLWGDNESYLKGAILNAQLIPYVYPGWMPRFYVDKKLNKKVVEILKNLGAQIVFIEDGDLVGANYMWRFLVADDRKVDFFICRDVDSRVNVKEANAVFEWVVSGRSFHVIRDHICHVELIHGGLWGGMTGRLPSVHQMLLNSKEYFNSRSSDQFLLNKKIWPLIKNDVLIHDSNYDLFSSKKISYGFELTGNHHIGEGLKSVSFFKNKG